MFLIKEFIVVSVDLGQATIGERANAFRHHCELAEAIKFKEIDMYVPELITSSLPLSYEPSGYCTLG